MTEGSNPDQAGREWSLRSSRESVAPVRAFLATESGSAGVLFAAVAAAMIWANIDVGSYERVWNSEFVVGVAGHDFARSLREWINSGLMTLFFLVVGLEARREVDLGDLRDRRRFVLPVAAGLLGMTLPVLIFLAVNLGRPSAHGWGVAMSTDTALALGGLAIAARHAPERVKVFLLTTFVIDDLAALVVIALAYSDGIKIVPLGCAVITFAAFVGSLRAGVNRPLVFAVLGVAIWACLVDSGIDPVTAGLAIGLVASAYSPSRESLEQATGIVRLFREQPTAELARSATASLTSTLSPNARLQRLYQPWTSYLIVPLFGLANAGIAIRGRVLAAAFTSPITLGIIAGYVVGKPVAITSATWLASRASGGRVRSPVGWAGVLGSGTIAGTGFTVALLIAGLAFTGRDLVQAKLGVFAAALLATGLTWVVFRIVGSLPKERKARLLLGTADELADLVEPVDPDRDHIRGPENASVTVVEYGDFECPYCGQAESAVRSDLLIDDDVRYVWRHIPLPDVHPHAQLAAEASEAAAAEGKFWEMHDRLLARQDHLTPDDLARDAEELGLDAERFRVALVKHKHTARVEQDVRSADLSGVSGTPTFFVNDRRYYGAYDLESLTAAIRAARLRSTMLPTK